LVGLLYEVDATPFARDYGISVISELFAPIIHVLSNSGEEFDDIALELLNALDRIIHKLPVTYLLTLREADCFPVV
jgi:hypothetical protein